MGEKVYVADDVKGPVVGDETRRVRLIGRAIAVVWSVVIIGIVANFILESPVVNVPESVAFFLSAVWFGLIVFVMYSCVNHLLRNNRFRGIQKLLWILFMLAGHVVGCTFYYTTVMRPEASVNRKSAGTN